MVIKKYSRVIYAEHSKCCLRKDNILEIHLEPEKYFTIVESKEISATIIKITENIPRKTLVIANDLATSDDEAREWASSAVATKPMLAMAIVINSLPQSLIANFIMKIQKPIIPTKIFNNIGEAESWLNNLSV